MADTEDVLRELFDHHGFHIDPEDPGSPEFLDDPDSPAEADELGEEGQYGDTHPRRGGPPYLEQATDPTAETYARKERAAVLQAEIAKLPLRYAEVLKLRYGLCGQEMTLAQIAEALGLSHVMVHKIEKEALKMLRQSRAIQSLASTRWGAT